MAWIAWRIHGDVSELSRDVDLARGHAELLESQAVERRKVVDALADGLDLALFVCDEKGSIAFANKTAVEMFDFAEPAGRSIVNVTLSNEVERLVLEAKGTGHGAEEEVVLRFPLERTVWARAWSDRSDPSRIFVTIHDITDLRRLERARRDFVANVSHELRTPLATIRAMAETLWEADESEKRELGPRYLEKIIAETDRLTLITDDLLTLGMAETEVVAKSEVDLAELVRSGMDFVRDRAESKGLELKLASPSSLVARVNPHQFSQVVRNLLDNAVNYTSEGSVEVSLAHTERGIELKVADTGIGIASEHLPRIFERFYRVDKGRSRATGGTGLGLSIVRHIAESHGGSVSASSTLGLGSTFTVVLPAGSDTPPHPESGHP